MMLNSATRMVILALAALKFKNQQECSDMAGFSIIFRTIPYHGDFALRGLSTSFKFTLNLGT